jgi:hyperosmotically inducible periplasmic protein
MPTRVRALSIRSLLVVTALCVITSGATFAQAPPPRTSPNYEQWLTREVGHELVLLPWLSIFDDLSYKVQGSEVTLMGEVVNPVTKDDAERTVKSIEGVTKVNDNIEVLPLSPMDDQIRRAEYRSIYGEPQLQRYAMGTLPPIHIIVKGGHVTLKGFVDNQTDKQLAEIRAKTVPNVFSVDNELQIKPGRPEESKR